MEMLADNFRFYFEIVPKGHHNCQLSILNCQFVKFQFTGKLRIDKHAP